MSGIFDFDLVVIGAGPGGYVAAIRASQLGLRCAVIEKDKAGGVCGNRGCIPSKSLLHQAEIFAQVQTLRAMGIKVDLESFDYSLVQKKSREASARAEKGVLGLLRKNKVDFITGTAILTGKNEVTVETAGAIRVITGKNLLLATGSRPRGIPGFEFDENQVLSSDGMLAMEKLPTDMLILGAGAIGIEFASILNAFGVKVTVIEMMDRILPHEDPDISKVMHGELVKKGITIMTGVKVSELEKSVQGTSIMTESKDGQKSRLKTEKILVAAGRLPNSENLGLEKLGITTDQGFVSTGDWYQTNVEGIYAIGDLVKSPLLAHVASKEGEVAVEHMAGHEVETKIDLRYIPSAVYTDPQVGSFGLTESEAKEKGREIRVFSFPYLGIGKAGAIGKTQGLVKLVCDDGNKEILGAHIVGYQASEIIHELLLAARKGLLPEDIASLVHAHPSISEGVMEAARGIEGWAIHL